MRKHLFIVAGDTKIKKNNLVRQIRRKLDRKKCTKEFDCGCYIDGGCEKISEWLFDNTYTTDKKLKNKKYCIISYTNIHSAREVYNWIKEVKMWTLNNSSLKISLKIMEA